MTSAWPLFNVRHFGAVGDGVSDDTAPIQQALDAALAAGRGIVQFGAGTFATTPLRFHGRTRIVGMGRGVTVLKLKDGYVVPNEYGQQHALLSPALWKTAAFTDDATIAFLTLDANRQGIDVSQHPSGEADAYCLLLAGVRGFSGYDLSLINGISDGLDLAQFGAGFINENVSLARVLVDSCWRNGVTIGAGKGIHLSDFIVTNTGGTAPQAALDIEPNTASNPCEDITLHNWVGRNNGQGVLISGGGLGKVIRRVKISNHSHHAITLNRALAIDDADAVQVSNWYSDQSLIAGSDPGLVINDSTNVQACNVQLVRPGTGVSITGSSTFDLSNVSVDAPKLNGYTDVAGASGTVTNLQILNGSRTIGWLGIEAYSAGVRFISPVVEAGGQGVYALQTHADDVTFVGGRIDAWSTGAVHFGASFRPRFLGTIVDGEVWQMVGQSTVLPPPSASYRGQIRLLEGSAGIADSLVCCKQAADGGYVWQALG